MGQLPIIQKDASPDNTGDDTLPTWYMADYSVLALVVEQPEAAIDVLQAKGFSIVEDSGKKSVLFDHPAGLHRIVTLLANSTVPFSISDSVTRIYQG